MPAEATFQLPELRQKLESITGDLVSKHNVAVDELTGDQIAEALKQAIECGDFIRHVALHRGPPLIPIGMVGTPIEMIDAAFKSGVYSQTVVYIPYAREQELEFEVERLKKLLTENGIEHRDLCQTPL